MDKRQLQKLSDTLGDLMMEEDFCALDVYDAVMDEIRDLLQYHTENVEKCQQLLDLFTPDCEPKPELETRFRVLEKKDDKFKLTSKYLNYKNVQRKLEDDDNFDVWKNK